MYYFFLQMFSIFVIPFFSFQVGLPWHNTGAIQLSLPVMSVKFYLVFHCWFVLFSHLVLGYHIYVVLKFLFLAAMAAKNDNVSWLVGQLVSISYRIESLAESPLWQLPKFIISLSLSIDNFVKAQKKSVKNRL